MDSLGNKFQTARESQGLTLGQMVSRTRIQEPHLKALEEGSFEQLPERVFTKGFVRAYARSLDLDEEECLRLFAESSASFYQKEGEGLPKFVLLKEDEHKGRTSRVMVVLLVVGLFLLGGLVLLQQQSPSTSIFSRFSQQAVEPRDEVLSEPERPGNANEVAEDRPPSSIERQVDASVANTETAPKTDIAEIPAASAVDDGAPTSSLSPPDPAPILSPTTESEDGPLVLELRTVEMTWVVVRSDENKPEEALLQAGEIVRWQANERFLLTLGNAGGVEVRLNGQLRGPFGGSGIVVRNLELRP
jgi:cytoskeleton protein RodZ